MGLWNRKYLPHYFHLQPSPFHQWLDSILTDLHIKRGSHWDILAPRGAAKSTWATQAYPIYAALEGLERFIVLCSDTGDQAGAYVSAIRQELESNEDLRRDYWPAIRNMRCSAGRIKLGNGVQIDAASTGGKIRGRKNGPYRPSLIIVDDPQNIDHVISPLMRDRSMQWLMKDVMEAGTTATNVLILGTALHRECIVCALQTRAGWKSKLWKSVEAWPERMDLWAEWEGLLFNYDDDNREAVALAFYEARKAEMHAGARVLWPERESLYDLMMKRAANGPASFASEKQNDPVDPSLCEWPADYFRWPGIMFDGAWDSLQLVDRIMAIDPSKGRDARDGDYFAICMLGVDHKARQFIEADLARAPVETRCADVCKQVRAFKPEEIVFETNQFQELIKPILKQTANALGVELPRIVDCENRENKELRIRRLGPDLAQRSVRFKAKSPGTAILIEQGMDFPHGSHDDGLDAWEMGRRRVKKGNSFELR